ncbi:cache domain-containing protein [Vibrio genomosp. F6]|uniref:cache domain-containing protein n=1 Tax=Vibrio genomosp. F6 TaxID=723172 RepID=UPI001F0E187F|nr:cache domain-containing protein [Vibrio genomosp. F6]
MKKLGFKSSMIACVVLIVAMVLLISNGIGYTTAKTSLVERINQQSISLVNNEADKIQNWFQSKVTAIEELSNHSNSGEIAGTYVTTARLVKDTSEVSAIFFAFEGGASYSTANTELFINGVGIKEKYNPTTRPWYKAARSSNGTIVTAPYNDAGTNKLVVSIAKSIKNGVVLADIELDILAETVKSIHFPGSVTAILDETGTSLASNSKALTVGTSLNDIGMNEVYRNMLKDNLSITDYTLQGVDKIGFTREVELVDGKKWYLFFGINKSIVYSDIDQMFNSSMYSSIIMVINCGGHS